MQKRTKIITGILSATLLIAGGVVAYAYPKQPISATQPIVASVIDAVTPTNGKLQLNNGAYEGEIKDGLASGQGTVLYPNGDKYTGAFLFGRESGKGMITQIINGESVVQEMVSPILTEIPKEAQDAGHRVPTPNDGLYHPGENQTAGIIVYSITFHEGFRAPGLKAVDVHIIARSKSKENELLQGRDEIVSITGTTGKVYNMIGTKRTGVNTGVMTDTFQEQELTEYQDVSTSEKNITSIVVRRDGTLITIKVDKDTKVITTHA